MSVNFLFYHTLRYGAFFSTSLVLNATKRHFFRELKGIDHCPGISIANFTTTSQVDHRNQPILFHMCRDPGERYPIPAWTEEYNTQISILVKIWKDHVTNLVPGKPKLNWCDRNVMVSLPKK